jgi:hypothetical protein
VTHGFDTDTQVADLEGRYALLLSWNPELTDCDPCHGSYQHGVHLPSRKTHLVVNTAIEITKEMLNKYYSLTDTSEL